MKGFNGLKGTRRPGDQETRRPEDPLPLPTPLKLRWSKKVSEGEAARPYNCGKIVNLCLNSEELRGEKRPDREKRGMGEWEN